MARTAVVAAVLVFIIILVILLVISPQTSPFPSIRDSDGDQVIDDNDFCPYGDGAVRVSVQKVIVPGGCPYSASDLECDMHFKIHVDANQNGIPDCESTTIAIGANRNSVENPYGVKLTCNIPDDHSAIDFYIEAWDDNVGINTDWWLDYNPGPGHTKTVTVHYPFSGSDEISDQVDDEPISFPSSLTWKVEVVDVSASSEESGGFFEISNLFIKEILVSTIAAVIIGILFEWRRKKKETSPMERGEIYEEEMPYVEEHVPEDDSEWLY